MSAVLAAWLVELGLITYRARQDPASQSILGLPLPGYYLSTFAVFGLLGMARGNWERPAAFAAWGWVAATWLNLAPGIVAKQQKQAAAPPTGTSTQPAPVPARTAGSIPTTTGATS